MYLILQKLFLFRLTNGGMLAEDEESNGENEAAYNPEQDVAEAQVNNHPR